MIKVLNKQVADKIAAGEVIDRPLSIVKELVENSIDAGATAITIEIKKGGKTYIRVTDNGAGIPEEETEVAFYRHATSKITEARDLESIETLGFRGEALASIAAVTRTELITRPQDAKVGTKIAIEGSQIAEKTAAGCPEGTTIVVRDLFFNTPARLKFMKSDAAESSLIIEFVSHMALAYSGIKIRLINNGTTLFSTTGKGDLYKNILTVYSREIGDGLIPVSASGEGIQMEGYISGAGQSRPNRKRQIFFINGRVISSKVIEKGISMAYSDKLFEGRHPIAFLFLHTPPDRLDVNIHPNKKEVRFHDENRITRFVSETLRKALLSQEAIPQVKKDSLFHLHPDKPKKQDESAQLGFQLKKQPAPAAAGKQSAASDANHSANSAKEKQGDTLQNTADRQNPKREPETKPEIQEAEKAPAVRANRNNAEAGVPESKPPENLQEKQSAKTHSAEKHQADDEVDIKKILSTIRQEQQNAAKLAEEPALGGIYAEEKPSSLPPFDFDSLTVIGTIFNTYIAAVSGNQFYLIDQHAAHERVVFEKLVGQYKTREKIRQPILTPIVLTIAYDTGEDRYHWMQALSDMGFAIEPFGPKTFVVREIPAFLELKEAEDFLHDFIDNIDEDTKLEQFPTLEKVITRSCKSAVKANDALSAKEIHALFAQLKQCENPFSCPHGRPTFVKISKYEIEKMFKRV